MINLDFNIGDSIGEIYKRRIQQDYNDGIKAVLSGIEIQPSIPSIFSPLLYRFEFFVTSAGVAPVRHAKWVLIDECVNEGVYCSNCHKKIYRAEYANQKVKSNFCPNCGSSTSFGYIYTDKTARECTRKETVDKWNRRADNG